MSDYQTVTMEITIFNGTKTQFLAIFQTYVNLPKGTLDIYGCSSTQLAAVALIGQPSPNLESQVGTVLGVVPWKVQ